MMWFLIVVVIIIVIVIISKNKGNKQSTKELDKPTVKHDSGTAEQGIKSDKEEDALDKLDATQDAATIWEMMKKSELNDTDSYRFKQRAYEKLSTSKDSYTCRLLGNKTFSYLDQDVKRLLIAELAVAYVLQVENENIPSLELAKMVAKQGKILDYDTFELVKNLFKEEKIYRNEFFKPKWINNPKIWAQTNYKNREYLIKLKIFLDTAPLHAYVDKDGQTICEVVGEEDKFSLWEVLINKYDNVNELKAFLSGFSDD